MRQVYKGRVDVTNCYAVPFEEDPKDPDVVFFDHMYHEDMFRMFKKINGASRLLDVVPMPSFLPTRRPVLIYPNLSLQQPKKKSSDGTALAPSSSPQTSVRIAPRVYRLLLSLFHPHLTLFPPWV
jgi:hypothetical protein